MNNTTIFLILIALIVINIITLLRLINIKKYNKKILSRIETVDNIANESYASFVFSSRDWAYEYIEDVQGKLVDFANKVEPHLDYFNTYGKAVPSPHTIILEEIDSAYKELRSVLPEENKEK